MLSVGMRYKGKPIGVLRVYTDKERSFTQLANRPDESDRRAGRRRHRKRPPPGGIHPNPGARTPGPHGRPGAAAHDSPTRLRSSRASISPPIYIPSQDLGGDFYDFIQFPYNNLGLVIADVSGKGIPASLTMAAVRAALPAQVDNVYYLYEVVRRVNLMVRRDSSVGEFVTLFYGVLDGRNRRFTYCNAGHPPALILRDGKIIELGSDNMVLGVNPDEKYTQSLVDLQVGDTLLMYTDGLTDAMNFHQETFGRQRLIEAFLQGGATADAVAQNIVWSMRRFAGLTTREPTT